MVLASTIHIFSSSRDSLECVSSCHCWPSWWLWLKCVQPCLVCTILHRRQMNIVRTISTVNGCNLSLAEEICPSCIVCIVAYWNFQMRFFCWYSHCFLRNLIYYWRFVRLKCIHICKKVDIFIFTIIFLGTCGHWNIFVYLCSHLNLWNQIYAREFESWLDCTSSKAMIAYTFTVVKFRLGVGSIRTLQGHFMINRIMLSNIGKSLNYFYEPIFGV